MSNTLRIARLCRSLTRSTSAKSWCGIHISKSSNKFILSQQQSNVGEFLSDNKMFLEEFPNQYELI